MAHDIVSTCFCRCTGTRFGLPFAPPISDGTGPLAFLLFIFRLRFVYAPDERLEKVIKVVQNLSEFVSACLIPLFPQSLVDFVIDHHESRHIVVFPRDVQGLVLVGQLGPGHRELDMIEQELRQALCLFVDSFLRLSPFALRLDQERL